MALFLFPENAQRDRVRLLVDLVSEYKAENCSNERTLILENDGTFTLQTVASGESNVVSTIRGQWKFRQYPFIELQQNGVDYAEYYFEIKQFTGADKVSEIDFVTLTSLNPRNLPDGCAFVMGTRI